MSGGGRVIGAGSWAKGAWSPRTLEVLGRLRAAALQQLVEQQQPCAAKQRVLHSQLLQVCMCGGCGGFSVCVFVLSRGVLCLCDSGGSLFVVAGGSLVVCLYCHR